MKITTLLYLFSITSLINTSHAIENKATHKKPIQTISLKEILFHSTREAPATVVSLNNSLISAEIAGEVMEILVQTGDQVKTDDVLAKLNCRAYEIAQHRARAALKSGLAKKGYAKQKLIDAKRLRESRTISSDHLNQRSTEATALSGTVGVLNADLDEASRRVFKCSILAAFDGVITARLANVGDYATPGLPIVQLLDVNNMEVSAKIQQQDVSGLKKASSIVFMASNNQYQVSLRTVVPLVNSRIRSFESRLIFNQNSAPSGSAGRLVWKSEKLHIPSDYMVTRNNQTGVFIYDAGKVMFYQLEGIGIGLPAIIELPETTQIVSTGRYGLIDGQLVNLIK